MRKRRIQGMSRMKLLDLGDLDTSVLLFGGPYSNLQATQALLEVASGQGITPSHMICTGDVVAYCADPSETIALLHQAGCPVVAGNCEKQLAEYDDHCGCGFEKGSTCDLLSAGWYAHANAHVSDTDRAWMGDLPDVLRFRHQGRNYAVIHGGVSDVSRFLWPTSPDDAFREEISFIQNLVPETSCIIAGHCGMAFQRRFDDVTWVNAGVIGMPAHDGTPQTAYAMLCQGVFSFHRLSYDHDAAHEAMRRVGLTQGYDRALLTGYWPSEDVLPPDLRVSASRAIG